MIGKQAEGNVRMTDLSGATSSCSLTQVTAQFSFQKFSPFFISLTEDYANFWRRMLLLCDILKQ